MLMTCRQLLILLLVFVASISAWGILLKMCIDSSLELKWSVFFWFFGACLVSAAVIGAFEFTQKMSKKRHATLNKNTDEMYTSLRDFFH